MQVNSPNFSSLHVNDFSGSAVHLTSSNANDAANEAARANQAFETCKDNLLKLSVLQSKK
jgi:hypothetical protein